MENKTKLVDFIVEKIAEESDDYAKYSEWVSMENTANISSVMKQIAEDERKHRDCLIKMLAEIAKGGNA